MPSTRNEHQRRRAIPTAPPLSMKKPSRSATWGLSRTFPRLPDLSRPCRSLSRSLPDPRSAGRTTLKSSENRRELVRNSRSSRARRSFLVGCRGVMLRRDSSRFRYDRQLGAIADVPHFSDFTGRLQPSKATTKNNTPGSSSLPRKSEKSVKICKILVIS